GDGCDGWRDRTRRMRETVPGGVLAPPAVKSDFSVRVVQVHTTYSNTPGGASGGGIGSAVDGVGGNQKKEEEGALGGASAGGSHWGRRKWSLPETDASIPQAPIPATRRKLSVDGGGHTPPTPGILKKTSSGSSVDGTGGSPLVHHQQSILKKD